MSLTAKIRVSTSPYYDYDEDDEGWVKYFKLDNSYQMPKFDWGYKYEVHSENILAKKSKLYGWGGRQSIIPHFSWAIPGEEAVDAIANLPSVVELGAGSGYWASLIKSAGGDITCFDKSPWPNPWHPVHVVPNDLRFMSVYKTLLLCWPPYDEPMATEWLTMFEGRYVAYIGEGGGGCTADDTFHNLLSQDFTEIDRIDIPQWSWLHDRLYIYERDL